MEDPTHVARAILSATFFSLSALASTGIGRHLASRLVREGRLVRVRNGRYLLPDTHPDLVRAARLGGQLDCVSLLGAMGIFVRDPDRLHVRFAPGTTRLPARPSDVRAHWRPSARSRPHLATDIIEALAQACRCQTPRDAVATLDSALHHGIIDDEGLAAVFRLLPARHQVLRRLVDPRSESGPESIVRLLLRTMGARIDVQVFLRGVGRVDFVVDGWLIIECDSKAHHEGWDAQRRDRRRDLAAATLGYTTIRPLAEDVLYRTDDVAAQLRLILAHGPRR